MQFATALVAATSLMAHAMLGCCAHHGHSQAAGHGCGHESAVATAEPVAHDHDCCHDEAPAQEDEQQPERSTSCGELPCSYTLTKSCQSPAKAVDSFFALPPAPAKLLSLGQRRDLDVATSVLHPATSLAQLRQILLI